LVIEHCERRSPRRARFGIACGNTVAITVQRVDGLGSVRSKTLAIAIVGALVAPIGGVARKGAA
jgi:hypothetical protein